MQKKSTECVLEKVVLKFFAKFSGKHLCCSILFNKVAGSKFNTEGDSGEGVFL